MHPTGITTRQAQFAPKSTKPPFAKKPIRWLGKRTSHAPTLNHQQAIFKKIAQIGFSKSGHINFNKVVITQRAHIHRRLVA